MIENRRCSVNLHIVLKKAEQKFGGHKCRMFLRRQAFNKLKVKNYSNITMERIANSRLAAIQQHLNFAQCQSTSSHNTISNVTSINQGTKFTSDFKKYASQGNKLISYFHDVPLDLDMDSKTVNMVVEIPRWTNAKFEISTKLVGNPIIQDTKKGKVRFVKNLFPFHGYIHNYGALPQTWEDPTIQNKELGLFGDGDPLDVCEIGAAVLETGEVKRVKILGSIALIDDGELDWKVIVVDVMDPLAQEAHDIDDVFVKCPGLLESTRQWFSDYKLPDGKPKNKFAYNGEYKNQQETLEIIQECRDAWRSLVNGQTSAESVLIKNSTQKGTSQFVEHLNDIIKARESSKEVAKIDPEVNKIYYCSND